MDKGVLCYVFHLWCSCLTPYSSSLIMWILSLKKIKSDVESKVAFDAMDVQVYDPSPSKAYVRMIEAELFKKRETLA